MTARIACWAREHRAVLYRALVLAACLATLTLALVGLLSPRVRADIAVTDIVADSGFAYVTSLAWKPPLGFRLAGDSGDAAASSTLQLLENGTPLGPGHAAHADIRTAGKGRYSHWGPQLWFSASDSSDPRSNGRRYSIAARASLHPLVVLAIGLFDALALLVAGTWLRNNAGFRDRLVAAACFVGVLLAALLAAGALGTVNEDVAPPKDASLASAVLLHALGGLAILLAQWAAGAGLAKIMLRGERASFANVALLGFALSLPFAAIFAVVALVVPFGLPLAGMLWLACCLPLAGWRPSAAEWRAFATAMAAILPFALVFGCWTGLLWHGPTATLPGAPSGDMTYYATSIVSLARQPYPYANLGYEYQGFGLYFNLLFPAIGAVFYRVIPLDPFLFIAAAGGASFILALGLALHAYARGTRVLDQTPHAASMRTVLVLAFIVANRYPFWVVESIPVVHAVPLVVAVAYWARMGDGRSTLLAFVLGVVGSALSKVVGAAVLAPFAAATALPKWSQMPAPMRGVAVAAGSVAAAYAAYLLYRVGWINFASAPFGPYGFRMMLEQAPPVTATLFVLRDVAAALLAITAFLFVNWIVACAVAGGFLLFLIYPYVLLFDFVCAAILLGLLACDHPERLRKYRVALLGSMSLAVPAVLLTDPAGVWSGLLWIACVGCTIWIATARPAAPVPNGIRTTAVAAIFLLGFGLVAAGRGYLVLTSGWQAGVLTSQVRSIWLAVKARTPPDALVFTDQTGTEPTLLGAWNTYAFIGERQIFASNLYMNEATRLNPALARRVLGENDAILRGTLRPAELPLRGRYSGYFAVVSRTRAVPAQWQRIFENGDFALYRIE